jgi:hypothetical protein
MISAARRLPLLITLAAIAGIASVIVPYVAIHGFGGHYSSPLFPLLRNAWELLELIPTLVLLLIVGGILGFIRPKNWLVLGSSTVLLFPLAAVLEMAVDPGSHNLWPIEFLLYVVLVAVPALAGSLLGSVLASVRSHAT